MEEHSAVLTCHKGPTGDHIWLGKITAIRPPQDVADEVKHEHVDIRSVDAQLVFTVSSKDRLPRRFCHVTNVIGDIAKPDDAKHDPVLQRNAVSWDIIARACGSFQALRSINLIPCTTGNRATHELSPDCSCTFPSISSILGDLPSGTRHLVKCRDLVLGRELGRVL